jgi:hypothetical protein
MAEMNRVCDTTPVENGVAGKDAGKDAVVEDLRGWGFQRVRSPSSLLLSFDH